MKRKIAFAMAAGFGALVSIAILPSGAQAATTKCAYEGYDRVCVTNYATYSSYQVCDNENDGRSVYAYGSTATSLFYHTDSYGGSCNNGTDRVVQYFKVCESNGACSPYVYM